MSFRAYFARVTVSSDEILKDWRWLVGPSREVWRVTTWGDAMLRDRDGSIDLLDLSEGVLLRIGGSEADVERALERVEVQDEWLRASLVDRQARLGMRPGVDECLAYRVPPIFGAGFGPENVEVRPIVPHFAFTGQLMQQVKALPAGTQIARLTVDGNDPGTQAPKRPWWRFW
ncbi:hypothetical protein [Sandaracinus amylolyticus]|uniref:T6SS immunity protein Tdi1 C-terminal domain-containing protein n=1 Tax=Sandaracinus amylolyticus TaxID=927083 RepID=A0A0F6YI08_9BACT|nr:hypothetical protein [Sandaracinus amylolyticus]AKF06195.1 hypothetical protein DB32_003344 [Sandaracinus amylolyticus]